MPQHLEGPNQGEMHDVQLHEIYISLLFSDTVCVGGRGGVLGSEGISGKRPIFGCPIVCTILMIWIEVE